MAIAFVFFADKMTHNWRLTLSCVATFSIFFFIVWLLKAQNFETSGGAEVKNDYSYEKQSKIHLFGNLLWVLELSYSYT